MWYLVIGQMSMRPLVKHRHRPDKYWPTAVHEKYQCLYQQVEL